MKLQDGIQELIQLAADAAASGTGEIPKAVHDRAVEICDSTHDVHELSKGIGLSCGEFLVDASLSLGMVGGLLKRLQDTMHKEEGEKLTQPAAFAVVDLQGRVLGIESMILDVAGSIESARTHRISESSMRARMGAVFLMLEETLAATSGELVKRGAFAGVAAAVDAAAAKVRAHCSGPYKDQLAAHLNELPA